MSSARKSTNSPPPQLDNQTERLSKTASRSFHRLLSREWQYQGVIKNPSGQTLNFSFTLEKLFNHFINELESHNIPLKGIVAYGGEVETRLLDRNTPSADFDLAIDLHRPEHTYLATKILLQSFEQLAGFHRVKHHNGTNSYISSHFSISISDYTGEPISLLKSVRGGLKGFRLPRATDEHPFAHVSVPCAFGGHHKDLDMNIFGRSEDRACFASNNCFQVDLTDFFKSPESFRAEGDRFYVEAMGGYELQPALTLLKEGKYTISPIEKADTLREGFRSHILNLTKGILPEIPLIEERLAIAFENQMPDHLEFEKMILRTIRNHFPHTPLSKLAFLINLESAIRRSKSIEISHPYRWIIAHLITGHGKAFSGENDLDLFFARLQVHLFLNGTAQEVPAEIVMRGTYLTLVAGPKSIVAIDSLNWALAIVAENFDHPTPFILEKVQEYLPIFDIEYENLSAATLAQTGAQFATTPHAKQALYFLDPTKKAAKKVRYLAEIIDHATPLISTNIFKAVGLDKLSIEQLHAVRRESAKPALYNVLLLLCEQEEPQYHDVLIDIVVALQKEEKIELVPEEVFTHLALSHLEDCLSRFDTRFAPGHLLYYFQKIAIFCATNATLSANDQKEIWNLIRRKNEAPMPPHLLKRVSEAVVEIGEKDAEFAKWATSFVTSPKLDSRIKIGILNSLASSKKIEEHFAALREEVESERLSPDLLREMMVNFDRLKSHLQMPFFDLLEVASSKPTYCRDVKHHLSTHHLVEVSPASIRMAVQYANPGVLLDLLRRAENQEISLQSQFKLIHSYLLHSSLEWNPTIQSALLSFLEQLKESADPLPFVLQLKLHIEKRTLCMGLDQYEAISTKMVYFLAALKPIIVESSDKPSACKKKEKKKLAKESHEINKPLSFEELAKKAYREKCVTSFKKAWQKSGIDKKQPIEFGKLFLLVEAARLLVQSPKALEIKNEVNIILDHIFKQYHEFFTDENQKKQTKIIVPIFTLFELLDLETVNKINLFSFIEKIYKEKYHSKKFILLTRWIFEWTINHGDQPPCDLLVSQIKAISEMTLAKANNIHDVDFLIFLMENFIRYKRKHYIDLSVYGCLLAGAQEALKKLDQGDRHKFAYLLSLRFQVLCEKVNQLSSRGEKYNTEINVIITELQLLFAHDVRKNKPFRQAIIRGVMALLADIHATHASTYTYKWISTICSHLGKVSSDPKECLEAQIEAGYWMLYFRYNALLNTIDDSHGILEDNIRKRLIASYGLFIQLNDQIFPNNQDTLAAHSIFNSSDFSGKYAAVLEEAAPFLIDASLTELTNAKRKPNLTISDLPNNCTAMDMLHRIAILRRGYHDNISPTKQPETPLEMLRYDPPTHSFEDGVFPHYIPRTFRPKKVGHFYAHHYGTADTTGANNLLRAWEEEESLKIPEIAFSRMSRLNLQDDLLTIHGIQPPN